MKVLTWAGFIIGAPSFLFGYIFSHATWKNDVLLCIGGSYWVIWMVFFFIKKYDEVRIRRRWMKEEQRKNAYEERIRNLYGPDDHRLFN